MSVSTKIVKPLEQGYLQVDAEYKGGYKRYFKVPERNARVFANEWVAKDKNLNLYSNVAYFCSIIIGVLAAAVCTRNIDGWFKKFLLQCGGAIGLTIPVMMSVNEYAGSKKTELMSKYNAKEIFYRA